MAKNGKVTRYESLDSPLNKLCISEVNKMSFSDFIQTFGSVIEHTPLAAATIWSSGPFADLNCLHRAFTTFISDLNEPTKAGVLRCHPDLAGKLAQSGMLSSNSMTEQSAAGLLDLSEQERKDLISMNHQYREKFNFPFIICARENKKDAIIREIRNRLGNSVCHEVECAIGEVCKIAWYRLAGLVKQDDKQSPHEDCTL